MSWLETLRTGLNGIRSHRLRSGLTVLGILIGIAAVILTVIQKVFAGPLPAHCEGFPDLHTGERLALAPVIALMLLIGLLPQLIVNSVNPTVQYLLAHWRF